MGQALTAQSSAARAIFDTADAQLRFSISRLCFEGPEEELTATVNQQPALFTTSVATWRAMLAENWRAPAFVAGHSLGELSALAAAGCLTFEDGLRLVQKRGLLMQQAGELYPGGMSAIIALDADEIEAICTQASAETGLPVQLANDNCPGQTVISGNTAALTRAEELAKTAGARKIVRLPITIAAHSELMGPAAEEFATAVDQTPFNPPHMPVIGNVTAQPLTTPDAIRAELKAQLTSSVLWNASMRYLLDQKIDTFVEVGPGSVLSGLMKRIDRTSNRIKYEPGV